MEKDRTFLIAEGLLSGDLDMVEGVIYYSGKMLCDRFREILCMDVRLCRKLCSSLNEKVDVENVECVVSSVDEEIVEGKEVEVEVEKRLSVLDRSDFVGIIYELSNDVDDKVYIGSTSNLDVRLNSHMLSGYIYDNWKIRYCGSYEILRHKKVIVRILKKCVYNNNRSLLCDESLEIGKRLGYCTNVSDPVSHSYLSEECSKKARMRKIARINYLYDKGVCLIKDVKLCDEDIVRLKYDLIKSCNEEIKLKKRSLELNRIYDISVIE